MKAPEKIYIHPDIGGREFLRPWLHRPANNESVEYTRTDAFIEKACDLLVNCIEDFMLRRMEIWDKECKKQTLENLRKAMKGE